MATQNSENTEVTINADGVQIKGGIIARILKWLGADITITGSGSATHTFPSTSSTLMSNQPSEINAFSSKSYPVTNDVLAGEDSENSFGKVKISPSVVGGIVLLYDTVLGADQQNVNISSIPTGTYKHLRLIVVGRSDAALTADNLTMQFNGVTGAFYDSQYLYANNTTVTAAGVAGDTLPYAGVLPAANGTRTSAGGIVDIIIGNYAGTKFEKSAFCNTGLVDSTVGNNYLWNSIVAWRNTAAITSIKVFPRTGGAKFKAGTRVTLYGFN